MELLNELIINIALFKVLISGNNLFVLPNDCPVYIELANTFDNLFENNIFYRKYTKSRERFIENFDL